MTIRRFFLGKAIGTVILFAVIGLVGSFFALNEYIYNQKQGDGVAVEPYRATLVGEYVCLPHIDSLSDPQIVECVHGLKTDVGEYFGLDFYLMSQNMQDLSLGQRFSANGLVTPVERISSDNWKSYPIEGIFSVTDSVSIK